MEIKDNKINEGIGTGVFASNPAENLPEFKQDSQGFFRQIAERHNVQPFKFLITSLYIAKGYSDTFISKNVSVSRITAGKYRKILKEMVLNEWELLMKEILNNSTFLVYNAHRTKELGAGDIENKD